MPRKIETGARGRLVSWGNGAEKGGGGGLMHFSDWFLLGESSSRCEYCGSSVYIFLHCSSCNFLDVFSFYSPFGCNFSATLSFFYDFHLRIFMHMRASESYIYSLSFPVRGAWSMHGYLYLSPPTPSCMCSSKHIAQNLFFLCILMSFIHPYPLIPHISCPHHYLLF